MTSYSKIDKVKFSQKLLDILNFVEEKTNEGVFLHISNELKELFDMLRDLKENNNNYIRHLTNSVNHYYRLKLSQGKYKNSKKHKCINCGRCVVDLETHQKRDICNSINREKIFSNKFKLNISNTVATDACISIQSIIRGYLIRNKLKN